MHTQPNHVPAEEDTVPPGDDSNTDPTPPLPADSGGNTRERHPSAARLRLVPSAAAPSPPDPGKKQEPDIDNERDIPSDGRDPEGEGMIQELDKPTEQNPDNPRAQAHGH